MAEEEDHFKNICFTVGLDPNFLHWFNFHNFPEDIQYHRRTEDWINRFLPQRYENIICDPERTTVNEAELLTAIGFRPNSVALKTICARVFILQKHIKLIECAQNFIRDEFKYNIDLSGGPFLRFPYELPRLNEWFLREKTQSEEDNKSRSYSVINVEEIGIIESKILQLSSEETSFRLFHGTDHESAVDIIEGIEIRKGSQRRDFSDGAGFYLINELEKAIKMAIGNTSRPAVLIYEIPKNLLAKFSRFSLCDKENEADWKTIVSQFRSGRSNKKLRKSLEKIDFIEGPMACSYELPPVAKEGSYQMCAISENFAEELDNHVHAVAFFDGAKSFLSH